MTQTLSQRLVRYAELKPCLNAFVDTRTPGSDRKENFTIIGPGVSENPNQHVHIPEPHGFNIGGARQPPQCLNSQHSHDTAEVFVVHTGQWRFLFGVNANDGHVDLSPGDTISIPTRMFRGFENIGKDTGFLFAVLGGDDPGKVTWAPSVFELADKYGLVLLEGGRLIDLEAGEVIPDDAVKQQPPSDDQLTALKTPDEKRLESCVASATDLKANQDSAILALSAGGDVEEAAVITPGETADGFTPGPIEGWWKHGFNLRRLTLAAGASLAAHSRVEEEVIFLHSGELTISATDSATDSATETVTLSAGDTITLPKGLNRTWKNTGASPVQAFVVRGTDNPQAPIAA